MTKNHPSLRMDTLYKTYEILHKRTDGILPQTYIDELFERLSVRLSLFAPNEQNLILDLLNRYEFIPLINYVKFFLETFIKSSFLDICLKNHINEVYVTPLIQKKQYGKIKGSVLLWLLIALHRGFEQYLREVGIICHYVDLKQLTEVKKSPQSCLLFVDDYIGSGKTADKAIEEILELKNLDIHRLFIITIAISKCGYDMLTNKYNGLMIYHRFIQNKGISDFYSTNELDNVIDSMQIINSGLNIAKKYAFGYGAIEGLISLNRTPNNTFPVFWQKDFQNRILFERNIYE